MSRKRTAPEDLSPQSGALEAELDAEASADASAAALAPRVYYCLVWSPHDSFARMFLHRQKVLVTSDYPLIEQLTAAVVGVSMPRGINPPYVKIVTADYDSITYNNSLSSKFRTLHSNNLTSGALFWLSSASSDVVRRFITGDLTVFPIEGTISQSGASEVGPLLRLLENSIINQINAQTQQLITQTANSHISNISGDLATIRAGVEALVQTIPVAQPLMRVNMLCPVEGEDTARLTKMLFSLFTKSGANISMESIISVERLYGDRTPYPIKIEFDSIETLDRVYAMRNNFKVSVNHAPLMPYILGNIENIKVKFGKGYPSWVAAAEIRFVRDDLRDGARSARPKFDGASAASAASAAVPPPPNPMDGLGTTPDQSK